MFGPNCMIYLLVFLVGIVHAFPILDKNLDSGVYLEVRDPLGRNPGGALLRLKQAAKAASTIRQVKKSFKPKAGEAIFWSGTHKGHDGKQVSVHGAAQKFAHAHGKSTINHGLAQHGIRIPDRPQSKYSNLMWNQASKVWAHRANGETHVVLGGKVRPASVYNTIEKPILMKNNRVTKLTEHNVETGKSTIVKKLPKRAHTI